MNIIELRASNFARLRAVEIRPDGSLVKITGKNGAGKTSVLRAIWTALAGRAAAPARPIREGAEKAVIKLDLGEVAITRTFSHGKHGELTTSLSVVDEDGAAVRKSPQALIDALLGDLSFDPLAFARLAPKDQFARLRALVADCDFDALAKRRQELYDERTDVNRHALTAEARMRAIDLPPGPEPEAIDVSAVLAELRMANAANDRRASVLRTADDEDRMALQATEEVTRLLRQVENFQQRARELTVSAATRRQHAGEEIDCAPLEAKLAAAEQRAETRRMFVARREREEEAAEARARAARLTAAIDGIDLEVRDAIASAKLPAGLSLDPVDGVVMLNDLPFASAGTASRIVASAEVAMALNPNLKVMLIDEGSELDSQHLALIGKLAEARDYQVWVARVEEGEAGVGFRIEDGVVAKADTAPFSPELAKRVRE